MGSSNVKTKKILVTAFEPFGQDTQNPSAEALKLVGNIEGVEIYKLILPVVYKKAADMAIEVIKKEMPDAVLCTGVAGGRDKITVEKIAINLNDAPAADNEGVILTDSAIDDSGPAAFFATIPVKRIVDDISAENIPVSVSYSAGAYVCNDIMFRILSECKNNGNGISAGFIHVPLSPEVAEGYSTYKPSMPSSMVAKAIEIALKTIAENL